MIYPNTISVSADPATGGIDESISETACVPRLAYCQEPEVGNKCQDSLNLVSSTDHYMLWLAKRERFWS